MMDRGSFNGPGGPHNRWQVPAQYGASMGAEHTLRSKVGMGFVPNSQVLRVNRNGLAQSGLAVADVVARAVNSEPQPAGIRSGIQVFLDGSAPVDKEPDCDINTNPLCDGGGPSGRWTNYALETVQRIGYGSFELDNGVLIAKNKAWAAGANRGTEGSQCGYNCFTWVEDAHPGDMNAVDYYKPDGTPIMRTVADYRQLNDARGILHYKVGVQNTTGAGRRRGESVDVPVYISHAAGAEPGNTVTLNATSVSDPSKTATATCASTSAGGTVGGSVPATLSLTLGAPATFGAFQPGVDKEYAASTVATVTSTAGDATLTSSDPGHLTNGAFSLPEALRVELSKSTWNGPASNDASTITFRQHIGAKDALRTGAYAKTLTFTLATTNP